MCTAVSVNMGSHFFGRNLDLEYSLGERVIVTPRKYPFRFRCHKEIKEHYSIIGMGIVEDDFPLYYEGTNEKGLSVAALRFPEAEYCSEKPDTDNIASFELIPWLLCQCKSVRECMPFLLRINITDVPFSKKHPPSPLHWLVADECEAIVIECGDGEVRVYENRAAVLTNSPAFPFQIFNLNNYMYLSESTPENSLSDSVELKAYSRGMGAMGLPGDMSSMSRFVRSFFIKEKLTAEKECGKNIAQFFHLLDFVSQKKGAVKLPDGKEQYTVYSCCCDTAKGVYYYRTYYDSLLRSVSLRKESTDGKKLISYPVDDAFSIRERSEG